MGTPVPKERPVLEDNFWYHCIVDIYQDFGPNNDCTQVYRGRTSCCMQGSAIKAWKAAGHQCSSPNELCIIGALSAQRLVACHGPFATRDACMIWP